MAYKFVENLLKPQKHFVNGVMCRKVGPYHYHTVGEEVLLPREWYEKAFSKLTRLSHSLKDLDLIDGKLVNVNGGSGSIILHDRAQQKMTTFKSLARVFIGSPSVQRKLKETMVSHNTNFDCFSKQSERNPMIVNSLTKVSTILNVSAQQRKVVRLKICPQVTQHRIWMGALEEMLKSLKLEIELLNHQCPTKRTKMGKQIVSTCLKFLSDATVLSEPDSTTASWVRLTPTKPIVVGAADPTSSRKWENVLEMFDDLIKYSKSENDVGVGVAAYNVTKLEVMKEGLSQIKDVVVDGSLGHREVMHQEYLVQKRLTKKLGHSSKCLFTLLLYYLYGCTSDIEVDMCGGGLYPSGCEKTFCLSMGRILSSNEEEMIRRGVKHLDKVLGVFKFVWEIAEMKEVLKLQGHLWCVGAEERSFTFRGNSYFVHGITL